MEEKDRLEKILISLDEHVDKYIIKKSVKCYVIFYLSWVRILI